MKNLLFAIGMTALLSAALAQEKEIWPAPSKPLTKAEYTIYSGELENAQAPTRNDRKLSIEISGQAAKEIFDSIPPDSKVTCGNQKGERLRRKRDLWCSYLPGHGYRCFLGYNLQTGESIPGGSC